jgi:hypothetical protein
LRDYVWTPSPEKLYGADATPMPTIIANYRINSYAIKEDTGDLRLGGNEFLGASNSIKILNASCQNGSLDMSDYSFSQEGDLPKFLFDGEADISREVCPGEVVHLYLDCKYETSQFATNTSFYSVFIDGVQYSDPPISILQNGVHVFEFTVPLSASGTIDVEVRAGFQTIPGPEPILSPVSETLTFTVLSSGDAKCCCDNYFYFLNNLGGFQKLKLPCFGNVEISIEGEYMELCDSCSSKITMTIDGTTRSCLGCLDLSGKYYLTRQVNTNTYDYLSFKYQNNSANRDFIKRVIASTDYYLHVNDCLEMVHLNLNNVEFSEITSRFNVPLQFISSRINDDAELAVDQLAGPKFQAQANLTGATIIKPNVVILGGTNNGGLDSGCTGTIIEDNGFPNSLMRRFTVFAEWTGTNSPVQVNPNGDAYWLVTIEDLTQATSYGTYAFGYGTDLSICTLSAGPTPNDVLQNEYLPISGGASQVTWETVFQPYFAYGSSLSNGLDVAFDKLNWALDNSRFVQAESSPGSQVGDVSSLKFTFQLIVNDVKSSETCVEMPVLWSHMATSHQGTTTTGTMGYPDNLDDVTGAEGADDDTLVFWDTSDPRGYQIPVYNGILADFANDCVSTNADHLIQQVRIDSVDYNTVSGTSFRLPHPSFGTFWTDMLQVVSLYGPTIEGGLTHPFVTGLLVNDLAPVFEHWYTIPSYVTINRVRFSRNNETIARTSSPCLDLIHSLATPNDIWAMILERRMFMH